MTKIQNRIVKCKVTGEQGSSLNFYRSESGEYFKSEEVYHEYRAEVDAYNKVKKIIDEELVGYDPNLPYNSLTPRNLTKLKDYSYQVILETVKRNKSEILRAVNKKTFKDSSAKCTYIFAIIKSRAIDVKRELDNERKMRKKTEQKLTEESLADKLMVEALNASLDNNQQHSTKDISAFLSEEELQ